MDYRPISLLQTGYKVFTKVMATRVQAILGKVIGYTQQGFVHGRQMMKTVMMMMAMLASAKGDQELAAALSRVIILLDVKKAYDTVAREFLFLALLRFGFSKEFVDLMRRLHDGTTASFVVNGERSEPTEVKSGIRQGCPLAPLLFLIPAEILALATSADAELQGIQVPGKPEIRHTFSAFVDDSTVFLQEARQLPRVIAIITRFGELSGLHVQPTKSKLIFLNTTIEISELYVISVLQHGQTTRYLGYEVGTAELTNHNWARRIRNIQRRLATATHMATNVDHRVTILNVIMLPAILFTAAVFDLPAWAGKQLRHLQKQFLWRHSLSTDASRYKINPGLLYTPRGAGGVGLVSIEVAVKAQRMKHALLWLTQKEDTYFEAWRSWAFRGEGHEVDAIVTPRAPGSRQPKTPGKRLQLMIGEWLRPSPTTEQAMRDGVLNRLAEFAEQAICWRDDDTLEIRLYEALPTWKSDWTYEEQAFWPNYQWNDNPWIRDAKGAMLTRKKFDRIQACSLQELQIQRTGLAAYSVFVPLASTASKHHTAPKLCRWALAIIAGSPPLAIASTMCVSPQLLLRHPPELHHHYQWTIRGDGTVQGVLEGEENGEAYFTLQQEVDGIHWTLFQALTPTPQLASDCVALQKERSGLVFKAHPAIHKFPWMIPETVANRHVLPTLKRLPFKTYKKDLGRDLQPIVERLDQAGDTDDWSHGALQQTPRQLWTHKNALTEYQVWVCYRIATKQLNLFFEGRQHDRGCRKLQCRLEKETLSHIFWTCPCAQACWQYLISHWTGRSCQVSQLQRFLTSCASRAPPAITPELSYRLRCAFQDEVVEYEREWKRIWWILSTVCVTVLWLQRNRVVHQGGHVTIESSVAAFQAAGLRQLRALAKRERRTPRTMAQGTRLLICLNFFSKPKKRHLVTRRATYSHRDLTRLRR